MTCQSKFEEDRTSKYKNYALHGVIGVCYGNYVWWIDDRDQYTNLVNEMKATETTSIRTMHLVSRPRLPVSTALETAIIQIAQIHKLAEYDTRFLKNWYKIWTDLPNAQTDKALEQTARKANAILKNTKYQKAGNGG